MFWSKRNQTYCTAIFISIIFMTIPLIINKIHISDEGENKGNAESLCVDSNFDVVKPDLSLERKNHIACADYYDSEGWHVFKVETFHRFDNSVRSFAAGFLEGYIYAKYINFHFRNINATIFNNVPLSKETKDFVHNQLEYVKELNKQNMDTYAFLGESNDDSESDYRETLSLVMEQYKGIYRGYKYRQQTDPDADTMILSEEDFYLITMQGDLEDIILAFEPKRDFRKEKDCSGYVKYVKETENLIVGHDTHNIYTLMNRIYKHYSLNITLSSGRKINDYKFSSRPGDFNSKDDYFVLSNRMVVLETSLGILDQTIYKNLRTNTIPKWIRVSIANKLCRDNEEWVDVFFRGNSGTHNNQWLVVDYNMFDKYLTETKKENNISPEKIVYLIEQIPLLDKKYYEDFSAKLFTDSYVASYNAPYFSEVIDSIGYRNTTGDYFHARRYEIFQNLNGDVKDIEGVKEVLRFHNKQYLCDTIAPRCDMVEKRPFGAVDAKVTDSSLINEMLSHIVYGPPHKEGVTEPFDFSLYPTYLHLGIPEVFKFEWIIA